MSEDAMPGTSEQRSYHCVDADGSHVWRDRDGAYHRTDGPAVVTPQGRREWYIHGRLHRTDGPAIDDPDGSRYWYIHGLLHRTDGPAAIYFDGTRRWCVNDRPVEVNSELDELAFLLDPYEYARTH